MYMSCTADRDIGFVIYIRRTGIDVNLLGILGGQRGGLQGLGKE